MDSQQLRFLLNKFGYFGRGLSDDARWENLSLEFWNAIPKEMRPKLRALFWRNIGKADGTWLDAIFAVDLKKAAPLKGSPKEAIKSQAKELANLYTVGADKIKNTIEQAFINGNVKELQVKVDKLRANLLSQGDKWIENSIPSLYLKGSGPVGSKAHAEAIDVQTQTMKEKLREADQNIGGYVAGKLTDYKKLKVKNSLANAEPSINVSYLEDGINSMLDDMEDEDIPGKRTIDGKVLGLAAFITALAITSSRDAYSEGVANVALEDGTDLVQISANDTDKTCDYCQEWSGKIVSVSGSNPDYPSLEDAYAGGVFHPNCLHYLIYLDKTDIDIMESGKE